MSKKGQLTIFVIIAIILVLVIVSYFAFKNYQKKIQTEIEIKEKKKFIESCVEERVKEGILAIAKQSGYYLLPENKAEFLGEKSVYYLKNNESLVPNKQQVETQLKFFLEENIEDCLKDVKKEKCNIYVQLTNTSDFIFDCKFIIKKDNKSYIIGGFEKRYDVDLIKFINMSEEIVENYKNTEKGFICIECLDGIAEKYDINITIVPIQKDMWVLLNSNAKINGKNLTWRFVIEI